MRILLKNPQIPDGDFRSWSVRNVLIEDDKIAAIGCADDTPCGRAIDCRGMIAVPGFINAHAHSYTGYLKGTIDNLPLDLYMLHAIAGGSCRSEREIYISSALEALSMLKSGTTAVVDHFSQRPELSPDGLEASVRAFSEAGMRARVATMFADKSFFDTLPLLPGELPETLRPKGGGGQSVEDYLAVVEESFLRHRDDPLVRIMLGTDGPQRCSDKLLLGTAELEERTHMGWQTHILEAKTQALVSRSFYGRDLIEHMDELGVLNSRTALVHSVWLSEREQEIVAARGATVVHCPGSNLHLGSGVAPVDLYRGKGIRVALGSDGGNCGSTGMLEQIKLAATLHNVSHPDYESWFSAADALRLDYEGGAAIFGEEIGCLRVGAQADLCLIDTDNICWQPVNDLTRQLVYYENGSHVDTVIVAGQIVLEKGKSTRLDERAVLEEAKEICAKLRRDCAAAFELVEKQTPAMRGMYLREIARDVGYNRFIR